MELTTYFWSVLQQDRAAVVICNLQHEIIYMNPAAVQRYAKSGGAQLVGRSLLDCHPPAANQRIAEVVDWLAASPQHNQVYTFRNEQENRDVYMVALRDEAGCLIGYYEKHEYRDLEQAAFYDMED